MRDLDSPSRQGRGLRHDPTPGHRRRGRPGHEGPGSRQDAGRHDRRQELGPARPRGPGRLARREPADDRRLGRLLRGAVCPRSIYDAEHFFDGFKRNPDYALRTLRAAADAGAAWIVLCDTNGGALPEEIAEAVAAGRARDRRPARHSHAQRRRARRGQRPGRGPARGDARFRARSTAWASGAATSTSAASSPTWRSSIPVTRCSGPASSMHLTEVSRYVYETANMNFRPDQPFVGASAFAHKGGMHVHGVRKNRGQLRAHRPGDRRQRAPGARQRALRQVEHRREARRVRPGTGFGAARSSVLDRVQDLENEGYQFEAAEASFVLLVERLAEPAQPWFERLGFHVSVIGARGETRRPDRGHDQAPGRRSISSIPSARATARSTRSTAPCARPSSGTTPASSEMHLVDYKVRVINARAGTAARVRVVIESQRRRRRSGGPSASPRTSSRRAGWRWSTPSSTSSPRTHGPGPTRRPPRPPTLLDDCRSIRFFQTFRERAVMTEIRAQLRPGPANRR